MTNNNNQIDLNSILGSFIPIILMMFFMQMMMKFMASAFKEGLVTTSPIKQVTTRKEVVKQPVKSAEEIAKEIDEKRIMLENKGREMASIVAAGVEFIGLEPGWQPRYATPTFLFKDKNDINYKAVDLEDLKWKVDFVKRTREREGLEYKTQTGFTEEQKRLLLKLSGVHPIEVGDLVKSKVWRHGDEYPWLTIISGPHRTSWMDEPMYEYTVTDGLTTNNIFEDTIFEHKHKTTEYLPAIYGKPRQDLVDKYGTWAVGRAEAVCPEGDTACVTKEAERLFNTIQKRYGGIPEYLIIIEPGDTTFNEGDTISFVTLERENARVRVFGGREALAVPSKY